VKNSESSDLSFSFIEILFCFLSLSVIKTSNELYMKQNLCLF
jgi:hypothetical protein